MLSMAGLKWFWSLLLGKIAADFPWIDVRFGSFEKLKFWCSL